MYLIIYFIYLFTHKSKERYRTIHNAAWAGQQGPWKYRH